MDFLRKLVTQVKHYLKTKFVVLVLSLSVTIPLAQGVYWIFEASYFGHFGISPEIFNRPIFSSSFISVWVLVLSIFPLYIAWLALVAVVYLVLVAVNFEKPKFLTEGAAPQKDKQLSPPRLGEKSLNWKKKVSTLAINLMSSIEKSVYFPAALFLLGSCIFLMFSSSIEWITEKGEKLAKDQIENYSKEKFECVDGFNSNNVGCFTIEGIDKDNLLVITNSETHLIYFSRTQPTQTDTEKDHPAEINLHIIEKAPGEVFKITRRYQRKS